jgi:hypothetical protein
MRMLASFSLLCTCFSLVSSTASFAGLGGHGKSVFGVIPRGGGLFGGKEDTLKYVLFQAPLEALALLSIVTYPEMESFSFISCLLATFSPEKKPVSKPRHPPQSKLIRP